MVNNQGEFNKNYLKDKEEIEITDEDFEEKELIIEDYLNLKNLYLRDIEDIKKITLKNLEQLQECTIRDCGTKELTIENCSQIEKLNVENNLLTNLDSIKDLNNLAELKINGNPELIELLKPYYNENDLDWRTYQKVIQGSSESIQELLKTIRNLKEEVKTLKEQQPITLDNPIDFERKYQQLKKTLHSLASEEQLKSKEIAVLKTKDLTDALSGKISDQEINLSELQKTKKELEKQLAYFEQLYQAKKEKIALKNKELEKMKSTVKDKLNNEEWKVLKKLLEVQDDFIQSNSNLVLKKLEKNKNKLSNKLTSEEIEGFCQLQTEITQLELEIQKKNLIRHKPLSV